MSQNSAAPEVAGRFLLAVDAQRWWLFTLAALLQVISFNGLWRIGPDSAVFLTVARSLHEGTGFTYNEQIYTRINPGFPYLLSALYRFTGESAFASLVLVHSLGIASLVLVFSFVRRSSGRPLAVLITFLTAVNVTFLRHCIEILADIPFLFACSLVLYGYELTVPRPSASALLRPGRRDLIVGLILIALGLAGAASLRIVFLAPVAALFIDLVWRVRRSRAKWLLLAGAVAVLGVALAIRLADPRGGMTLLPKERQMLTELGNPSTLLTHIRAFSLPELAFNVFPRAVLGNKAGLWPVDLLITLVIAASGLALVRRHVFWGVLVAVLYVQWLLFYPDTRYFLPIIPLLMLAWWDFAVFLAARVPVRWSDAALVAPMLLLAGANLARSVGFAIEQHRSPFLNSYLRGRYEGLPEIAALAADRLPKNAVLLANEQLSEPLHYFSRRRIVPMYQRALNEPVPPDRPLFVLLPADASFRAALAEVHLLPGEQLFSIPRAASADPLAIAPLTNAPVPR